MFQLNRNPTQDYSVVRPGGTIDFAPHEAVSTPVPATSYMQTITVAQRVNEFKKDILLLTGLMARSLGITPLATEFAFDRMYADRINPLMANTFFPAFNSFMLRAIKGLPLASNLTALTAPAYIMAVNKVIQSLHVALKYYCWLAEKSTGIEKAKNEAKKEVVAAYVNWFATGYRNAVSTAGGKAETVLAETYASRINEGVEVYNWQGETVTTKHYIFAASTVPNKPLEVVVGNVTDIPQQQKPYVKPTATPLPTAKQTPGINDQSTAQNTASGSGSEVPDGAQSLVNNLTDEAKAIAEGKQPGKWWWWLVGAGVAGYLLKGSGKGNK